MQVKEKVRDRTSVLNAGLRSPHASSYLSMDIQGVEEPSLCSADLKFRHFASISCPNTSCLMGVEKRVPVF